MTLERHHQRGEQFGRAQRPVAQRLARAPQTVSGEHALLARERAVVSVLRHRRVGEQPGTGVAACQRRRLLPRGADRAAPGLVLAAVLQPRVLQHLEPGRRVLQYLGHFLADAHHACDGGLVFFAEVVLDASTRQALIDGRATLAAPPVALDLIELFRGTGSATTSCHSSGCSTASPSLRPPNTRRLNSASCAASALICWFAWERSAWKACAASASMSLSTSTSSGKRARSTEVASSCMGIDDRRSQQWAGAFAHYQTLTAAMRDRLLQHAHIVQITGESFRVKDQHKASQGQGGQRWRHDRRCAARPLRATLYAPEQRETQDPGGSDLSRR